MSARLFRPLVPLLLLTLMISTLASGSASAEKKPDNSAALDGVKRTKAVFLIRFDEPGRTGSFMKAILATDKGLEEEGVESDMVVVFIGKAVRFLTTTPDAEIAREHGKALETIAETARDLKSRGIRMEVCGAATKRFGVDNATILDEMDVVGNGFISLIGWQTQGYVPMTF